MKDIFTVYVLYSSSFNKIYVGYTSNLIERFKGHNLLDKKGWTNSFRPWMVVHFEVFDSKGEGETKYRTKHSCDKFYIFTRWKSCSS